MSKKRGIGIVDLPIKGSVFITVILSLLIPKAQQPDTQPADSVHPASDYCANKIMSAASMLLC